MTVWNWLIRIHRRIPAVIRDYHGGHQVDPAVVAAGHAAYPEALRRCKQCLLALCSGDNQAAENVIFDWLESPAEDAVMVGRVNAVLSVLLQIGGVIARERSRAGSEKMVYFTLDPHADIVHRVALTAICCSANGDPGAALDVLLAYKISFGQDRPGAVIAALCYSIRDLITQDTPGMKITEARIDEWLRGRGEVR